MKRTKIYDMAILFMAMCMMLTLCLSACVDSEESVADGNTSISDSNIDNVILFGEYPQSQVTDSAVIDALTANAGTLPTELYSANWQSYGYYISGKIVDFMWYIDIEYDGGKYRGVYFTNYRPSSIVSDSSQNTSYQDDNGYYVNTAYWFKYEPIKWRILTESDGKAFLLADIALDSQEYYITSSGSTREINEATIYENNYAYSTIRTWLNETFYNTAFNDLEKQAILSTTVDNSEVSTGYSNHPYYCENTYDKVFLPSYAEIEENLTSGTLERSCSDYAKSQGCEASTLSGKEGNCWWWLRSPHYANSCRVRYIYYGGNARYYYNVYSVGSGIVPALWISR